MEMLKFNVELTPPLYRGDVCKLDKLQLTGKKEEAYLRNKNTGRNDGIIVLYPLPPL